MTEPQPATDLTTSTSAAGLTTADVEERVRAGRTNRVDSGTTRSVGAIVRQNVITRFNILLGSMAALLIAVGDARDALFALVLVANTGVGVVQEIRAKRTLDRLALLDTTTASVRRDGTISEVAVDDVVVDDLVVVHRGDQIVADGIVASAQGLEIDEGLLTGESDPVPRPVGDRVLSGSVVVAGSGSYIVDRAGPDAYANTLAGKARRYQPSKSEIGRGIDQILRLVTWLIVPTAALLIVSQIRSNASIPAAVAGSVAGVVSMVPEGLVLLASMAMAVSVVRLGRKSVLTRELQAIEGLARVDIICVDKTGTLTQGGIRLDDVLPFDDNSEVGTRSILGAIGAADPNPNPSLAAIAAACPPPGWAVQETVPFSSERKWSAFDFGEHGAWVLGAPDVLLDDPTNLGEATRHLEAGKRVLVLAEAPGGLDETRRPGILTPTALLVLSEQIKDDARSTLAYFADQNVAVKVVSGDHPTTVAAVASAVGLDGGHPVDASLYVDDPAALVERVAASSVVGRVGPEQKQIIVNGLQARGHTVAMTGDGVNDLLALKDAHVGIAMGSGSAASRAVAQFVLLDDQFAGLPGILAEGRRVVGNLERVGKLFLSKTMYALLLSLAVGVAQLPFPMLPRQLSIIGALSIGIPGFFLALAPDRERAQPGFVGRVITFAVPAGIVAAVATFAAYSDILTDGTTLPQSRTAASVVLYAVGAAILVIVARPFKRSTLALHVAMASLFVSALILPSLRAFYAFEIPPALSWVETGITAAIAVTLLAMVIRRPELHRLAERMTRPPGRR